MPIGRQKPTPKPVKETPVLTSLPAWVSSRPEFKMVAKQSHPARLCAVPPASRPEDSLARISQWLGGVELLAGASADKLKALAKVVKYRNCARGVIIRHEDPDGPGRPELCVVYSGQVALCRDGEPVAYLDAGQAFGAIETIQSELAGAAAVATGRAGAELLILQQVDYDEAALRFRAGEAWEDVDFLSQHPLLEGWGRSELLRLRGSMVHRVLPAGELVCRQGEEPRALWLLKRGVCEAQRTRVERVAYSRGAGVAGTKTVRRRLLLGRILPGGIFGEAAVVRGTPRFADVVTVSVVEMLELPSPSLLLLAKHNTLGALAEQVSRYPTDEAVEARLEAMVRGDEGAKHARAQMRRERLGRLAMQWSHSGVQNSQLRDADGSDLMLGGQVTGKERRQVTAAATKQTPSGSEAIALVAAVGDEAGQDMALLQESKTVGAKLTGRTSRHSLAVPPGRTTSGLGIDKSKPRRASHDLSHLEVALTGQVPLITPGVSSPTNARSRSSLSALRTLRSSSTAVRAATRMNINADRRMVRHALTMAPEMVTVADEMILERLQEAADERRSSDDHTGNDTGRRRGRSDSKASLQVSRGRVLGAVGRRGSVSAVVGNTLDRLDSTGGIRLDARASVHLSAAPLTTSLSGSKDRSVSDAGYGRTAGGTPSAASRLLMAMGTKPGEKHSPVRGRARATSRAASSSSSSSSRQGHQAAALIPDYRPEPSTGSLATNITVVAAASPVLTTRARSGGASQVSRAGRRGSISKELHSLKAAAISHSVATAGPTPLRAPPTQNQQQPLAQTLQQAPSRYQPSVSAFSITGTLRPPSPAVPPMRRSAAPPSRSNFGADSTQGEAWMSRRSHTPSIDRSRNGAPPRHLEMAAKTPALSLSPLMTRPNASHTGVALQASTGTASKAQLVRLAQTPPGSPASALLSGGARSDEVHKALRQGKLTLQEAGRSMGLAPLLKRGHAHKSGAFGRQQQQTAGAVAAAASPLTWQAVKHGGGGWEAAATAGAAAALQRKPSFVSGKLSRTSSTASAFAGMASVVQSPSAASPAARSSAGRGILAPSG